MKTESCKAKDFCNCPVEKCPRHPSNHDNGCDPCIQDNLKRGKMPACFFRAVHDDVSEVKDYTMEGFVSHFLKHKEEYRQKFNKKQRC